MFQEGKRGGEHPMFLRVVVKSKCKYITKTHT